MSKEEMKYIAQLLNSLEGAGCQVDTDEDGQIIVYTNCKYDDDEAIVSLYDDDEEEIIKMHSMQFRTPDGSTVSVPKPTITTADNGDVIYDGLWRV